MADVYLPADSQRHLIQIARQTLEDFVCGRGGQCLDIDDPYLEAADYGAFVTLFKNDELRGCICHLQPLLHHTVAEMTEAAATSDSLMKPVRRAPLAYRSQGQAQRTPAPGRCRA